MSNGLADPALQASQLHFELCGIQVQLEDRITLPYDTVEDQGRGKPLLTCGREDAAHSSDHRGYALRPGDDSPDRA
jgi:hypothetical protein